MLGDGEPKIGAHGKPVLFLHPKDFCGTLVELEQSLNDAMEHQRTAIAIYFIIWWIVLFIVLPWGVRSQQESGEVAPGTDPGAPARSRIWRKLLWTTVARRDRVRAS